MIKDIAFTAYPSNDVASARAWYEKCLGLTFAGPYCEDGVEKYNEAHFVSGCFSLIASEWVGREPGSAASVVFEVDDIDSAVQALHANGVVVEAIQDGPVCKQTSFCDPEGNKVTIHQKSPGRRSLRSRADPPTPSEPVGPKEQPFAGRPSGSPDTDVCP